MGFDYIEWMKRHIGHKIVCVAYGHTRDPEDVCIECETCSEVLFSAEALMLKDADNNFIDEIDFDYAAED